MKRYVQVGCGHRGVHAYSKPMVENYGDCAELCGVYDLNYKRAELVSKTVGKNIPVYDDFNKMLDDVKPDTVIVTCKDGDHDKYIINALDKGYNVISEKPLTTTFEKALSINEAQKKSGKDLTVTFNLRFQPFFKFVKELIKDGCIGDILSVHFEWMLDTKHGADYFRRWHRIRDNSGSLLVHKSTHHFDLVNWFLEENPVSVNAFGTRRFYGPTREERSERCLTCPYKEKCEFYFDIENNEYYKSLYLDCEDVDGYYRDQCIFSEKIDIEDTLSVNVAYSGGAVMSYSLIAHCPYEGINLNINGTKGRMEVRKIYRALTGYDEKTEDVIRIITRTGEIITPQIPETTSEGHGGADDNLRDALFKGMADDPLKQKADFKAGMYSIAIGMAANISMKENRRVDIGDYFNEKI